MSNHNICFRGEIRKIFTGYPPLSRPIVINPNGLDKVHLMSTTTYVSMGKQETYEYFFAE